MHSPAREQCTKGNRKRGDELSQLEPRIPVSQTGHCPRQAILEAVRYHPEHPLHAEPTHGFDPYVKEIVEAGNVWEHQTGKALAEQFDGVVHWERDDPALRVRNGVWSGHIDFLIEECASFPGGAIIIPTYLYYRSWSNWVRHTPPPWPGDFNRVLVTSRRWGGGRPLARKVAGGRVWFTDPGREDMARMPAKVRPPGRAGGDRGDDDPHAGGGGLFPRTGCTVLPAARADSGTPSQTSPAEVEQEPLASRPGASLCAHSTS